MEKRYQTNLTRLQITHPHKMKHILYPLLNQSKSQLNLGCAALPVFDVEGGGGSKVSHCVVMTTAAPEAECLDGC